MFPVLLSKTVTTYILYAPRLARPPSYCLEQPSLPDVSELFMSQAIKLGNNINESSRTKLILTIRREGLVTDSAQKLEDTKGEVTKMTEKLQTANKACESEQKQNSQVTHWPR